MATIQIKSGKKTQEFSRADGKKFSLTIDFGDTDKYADWIEKSKELQSIEIGDDAESMRKIKPLMRELVTMLFGRFMWSKVLRFCEGNVFAVGTIIQEVSKIIADGVKENAQK